MRSSLQKSPMRRALGALALVLLPLGSCTSSPSTIKVRWTEAEKTESSAERLTESLVPSGIARTIRRDAGPLEGLVIEVPAGAVASAGELAVEMRDAFGLTASKQLLAVRFTGSLAKPLSITFPRVMTTALVVENLLGVSFASEGAAGTALMVAGEWSFDGGRLSFEFRVNGLYGAALKEIAEVPSKPAEETPKEDEEPAPKREAPKVAPTLDVAARVFREPFTVIASQAELDAGRFREFRYTTTGLAVTSCTDGAATVGPIVITGDSAVTLHVVACDTDGQASPAALGAYVYDGTPPLTPTLDIATKVFATSFVVTASQNAVPDLHFREFRYTTSGTPPASCAEGSATSGAITVQATAGVELRVIACDQVGNASPAVVGSYQYDATPPPPPTLDIPTKHFAAPFAVFITPPTVADPNFKDYRYTLTGASPSSCTDGIATQGPIGIGGTSNVTLTAIACDKAGNASTPVVGTYTYDATPPLTPSLDIYTKVFKSSFTVRASQNATADSNFAHFRYTTSGAAPTCASGAATDETIVITGPGDKTLRLIACDQAGNASAVTVGTYVFDATAPSPPVLSPPGKYFTTDFDVTVTRTDNDPHFAAIRYTTNGTAPADCSTGIAMTPPGTIAVTGTGNVTIKAIACDSVGNASTPVIGTYVFDPGTPIYPVDLSGNVNSFAAGACQYIDLYLSSSPVIDQIVQLGHTGSGSWYADSRCEIAISATTIASGSTNATAYFLSPSPETLNLSAAVFGDPDYLSSHTVTTTAPNFPRLVVSGPATSFPSETCAGFTATARDYTNGQEQAVVANKTISLLGAGLGTFYADAACSTSVTDVVMQAGQSSVSFFYKAPAPLATILVALTPGIAQGTTPITVTSTGEAVRLTLSGSASTTATVCSSAYTVRSVATDGTPTNVRREARVTVSGAGRGTFYADSACTIESTSVAIASGTSLAQIYYRSGFPGANTFRASAQYLTAGSLSVTTTAPANAGRLTLAGPATLDVGVCSSAFTVTARDSAGIASNVATPVVATLEGGGDGYFYSDAGCTLETTTATIAAGGSTTSYFFKDARAESLYLTVLDAAGELIGATTAVTVLPEVATKVVLADIGSACALFSTGKVKCWGYGYGSSALPIPISEISGAIDLATESQRSCAALQDGSVKCWSPNSTPSTTVGISTATGITAGYGHTCARLANGTIKCWGNGANGQLGHGHNGIFSSPVTVGGITTATQVDAGNAHTCAVLADGTAKCWGLNSSGQLGDGTTTNSNVPVNVAGLAGAAQIMSGRLHTCARLTSGSIKCWGHNSVGSLGNGSTTNSPVPVDVSNVSTATDVAVGEYHSCARLGNGTIQCWGLNSHGALGIGTSDGATAPIAVSGIANALNVAAGNNTTCSVLADGTMRCWGYNYAGGLGIGVAGDPVYLPQLVDPPYGLLLQGSSQVETGQCFPITIQTVKPGTVVPKNSTTDTAVQLSAAANVTFYDDYACTNPSSTALEPAGEDVAIHYAKATSTGGNTTIRASTPEALATLSLYVTDPQSEPSVIWYGGLDYSTYSPHFYVGRCHVLDFIFTNSAGPYRSSWSREFDLNSWGNAQLFTDADCTSPLTTPILPAGNSMLRTYVKNDTLEYTYGELVDRTSGNHISAWINFTQPAPLQLGFLPTSFVAGSCQRMAMPAYGLAAEATLSQTGSGSWYADSSCKTPITTVLSSGPDPVTAYFMTPVAETFNVAASIVDPTNIATWTITTTAPAFPQLVVSAPSTSFAPETCAGVDVSVHEFGSNALQAVSVDTNVTLLGAGIGAFYTNASCTTPASSVTILSTQSAASFFYKAPAPASTILVARATGIAQGTLPVTVTSAGEPVRLTISGSASIPTNTCSPAYSIRSVELGGAPANVRANTAVDLTDSGHGALFADSACTTPATALTLTSGTSLVQAFYRNPVSETATLRVVSDFLTSASLTVTTVPATNAGRLQLLGPASVSAGACSTAFMLTTQNGSSVETPLAAAATISLGGAGDGAFYGDAGCSTPISAVTLAAGASTGSFHYKSAYPDSRSLSATDNAGAIAGATIAVAVLPEPAIKVATGAEHTCSLFGSGRVKCWGSNSAGQLGSSSIASSRVPVEVGGISTAIDVAAGGHHACAVLSDRTVKCWGLNNVGQLGNGTTSYSATPVPATVVGLGSVAGVMAGWYSTCARLVTGSVKCWGSNWSGQLGNDSLSNFSSIPVTVAGVTSATALTLSESHACARLAHGSVVCWGNNSQGQLGDGSLSQSRVPVRVYGVNTATGVAAGTYHTCARLLDGTVKCWGANDDGQLGNGSTTSSRLPVTVANVTTATDIAAGRWHVCVRLANASVRCWGQNSSGQLGNGSIVNAVFPVSATSVATAVDLSAAAEHTCARLQDGALMCWGSNYSGELGNDFPGRLVKTPLPVGRSSVSLELDGVSTNGEAGTCLALTIAESLAGSGVQRPFTANRLITLTTTASEGIQFFRDPQCQLATTQVEAREGTASLAVYVSSSVGTGFRLHAAATGVIGDYFDGYFTSNGIPSYLQVQHAPSSVVDRCEPMVITVLGENNGLHISTNNAGIDIQGLTPYTGIFTDAACTQTAAQTAIPAGSPSTTVYVKNGTVEVVSLSLTSMSHGISTSTGISFVPPYKADLAGNLPTMEVNTCHPITMTVQDGSGTPQVAYYNFNVSLANTGAGAWFDDSSCTNTIDSFLIPMSASGMTAYFKPTAVGTIDLTTVASGEASLSSTHTVTVTP